MRICIFGDAKSVHIQQLVPGLVAHGTSVHVVTHKPADVPGATVERFCVPPPSLTNMRTWRSRQRAYLRSFLRRFDVVNIQFLADWGFGADSDAGVSPEELSRGCVVATAWGSDIVNPPGETPAPMDLVRTRVALLQRAAAVTTCGTSFAHTVAEFADINFDAIEVVPFGVDLDLFRPNGGSAGGAAPGNAGQRWVLPADAPVIGYFKGFREVYGPIHFIRAMPRVLGQFPHARFEMIGDGPCLADCQSLACKLGVSASVSWIHRQRHGNLPRYLTHWTVSVIPSVHEAFGVAALESQACQVPVVASDVCGLRDTVSNQETGLLVPPCDSDALAAAVIALLHDANWCDRLGAEGRRLVEREFDWDDLHPRWIQTFQAARDRRCVMV